MWKWPLSHSGRSEWNECYSDVRQTIPHRWGSCQWRGAFNGRAKTSILAKTYYALQKKEKKIKPLTVAEHFIDGHLSTRGLLRRNENNIIWSYSCGLAHITTSWAGMWSMIEVWGHIRGHIQNPYFVHYVRKCKVRKCSAQQRDVCTNTIQITVWVLS